MSRPLKYLMRFDDFRPVVPLPRVFGLCGLFGVGRNDHSHVDEKIKIAFDHARALHLQHSGPRLDQSHLSIWLAVSYLFRHSRVQDGDFREVAIADIQRLIDWSVWSVCNHKYIWSRLRDLAASRISIDDGNSIRPWSLIEKFESNLGGKTLVAMNPQMMAYLDSDSADIDLRRSSTFKRNNIALWVHNYFSCHLGSNEIVADVEELHSLSGSGYTLLNFRYHLVSALKLLAEGERPLLCMWSHDQIRDTVTVRIEVVGTPKNRQTPRHPRTPGYVYILTNPAMPGLIKIGKTRLNPTDRAAQLHTTGVPRGFQVEYACHTSDPEAVEQAMHVAFGPRRVNDRREFFEIEPEHAIAVLSLHHQAEPSTTIQ